MACSNKRNHSIRYSRNEDIDLPCRFLCPRIAFGFASPSPFIPPAHNHLRLTTLYFLHILTLHTWHIHAPCPLSLYIATPRQSLSATPLLLLWNPRSRWSVDAYARIPQSHLCFCFFSKASLSSRAATFPAFHAVARYKRLACVQNSGANSHDFVTPVNHQASVKRNTFVNKNVQHSHGSLRDIGDWTAHPGSVFAAFMCRPAASRRGDRNLGQVQQCMYSSQGVWLSCRRLCHLHVAEIVLEKEVKGRIQ